MRTPLLAALLAGLVLAGCASNGGGDGGGGGITNTPLTTNDARTLLSGLDSNMPDRYGMDVTLTKDAKEAMHMVGAFDNATGEAYMEITVDPSAFPEASGGMEGSEALFANGFAIYVTKDGNAYIVNDTVFTFPAEEEGSGNSFVPSPDESPFGEFMDPESAFGDLDDNATIHSVKAITHKGKPAAEIVASVQDEDGVSTNATIIVYRSPARLARITGDIPTDDEDSSGFSGGTATVDLTYDDEVTVQVPQKAKRAIGLLYENSAAFGFGGFGGSDGPATWTFQNSAGIALSEVEAQVKDAAASMDEGSEDAGPDAIAKAPTLWSMKLSDGTKTQDGVTLTFEDVDADGKVSEGDTLTIDAGEEGSPPQVVLFDTVTGAYVVPGPGLLLVALALAGAAALTLRRK